MFLQLVADWASNVVRLAACVRPASEVLFVYMADVQWLSAVLICCKLVPCQSGVVPHRPTPRQGPTPGDERTDQRGVRGGGHGDENWKPRCWYRVLGAPNRGVAGNRRQT